MSNVGTIEAVLSLNASGFDEGITTAKESIKSFVTQVNNVESGTKGFSTAIRSLLDSLNDVTYAMDRFNKITKEVESFNKFANGVKALATAVKTLGTDSEGTSVGLARVTEIIKSLEGTLTPTKIQITGVANALRELNNTSTGSTSNIKTQFSNLRTAVDPAKMSLVDLNKTMTQMDNSTKIGRQNLALYGANLRQLAVGVEAFNSIETKSVSTTGTHADAIHRVSQALQQLSGSYQAEISATERDNASKQKENAKLQQVIASDERLRSIKQQLAQTYNQESASSDKATNSMRRQTSASKRLGGALSSLKMMGTMVGSMIAYNFAHNLAMATNETINAKSEMNGYFEMLGYTTRQTKDFNNALEETVQKFPRLNKYALGETISSIGVEFELTTEEMKKAMPVVSMITSEYLRAGRNVNEASLAVKDILQGEFQRLSRETGVKGDQLKEAGWSGDKTDVMGLLKALEKVGKERNWDTFVQKANSLNDAVLILQNRFSEWSADMVEKVQPSIVGAFNTIMVVGQQLGSVINGITNWLGGDGLGQSIVKWGGLATAIGVTIGALIKYRTGATLVQFAQMGLTKSITATILGLEAETTAEYGSRTALLSKITGIEAETIGNDKRFASILAVVSGLEAEEVATIGKSKVLFASLLGLDMATLKEHGFAVALAESTTGMEAQTIASKGLLTQIGLIGATTIPAIAVVGAFAVAFGKLAMDTMRATEQMSKFFDIQQNGEQYVSEAKDSVVNLKEQIKDLKSTQKSYTKDSQEYKNVGEAIDSLNDKLKLAEQNVNSNYEALQKVNSAQKNYDNSKLEGQLDLQRQINSALVDTGLSTEEINELSNSYLNDAIEGSKQLYSALQSVRNQYSKTAGGVSALTEYWKSKGYEGEELAVKISPYISSGNAIAEDLENMKLSTNIIEVVATWGKLQIDQWQHSMDENLPKIEAGDWIGGLSGFGKGLLHFFADLPVFGNFQKWIGEHMNFDPDGVLKGRGFQGIGDALSRWIGGIFNDLGTGTRVNLTDFIFNKILHLDTFGEDFSNLLSNAFSGTGIDLYDLIFNKWLHLDTIEFDFWSIFDGFFVSASDGSSDHPSFMEDLSAIFGFDVQTWVNNFMADPLTTLGIDLSGFDVLGTLTNFIFNNTGGSDSSEGSWINSIFSGITPESIMEFVNTSIITPFGNAITIGILNIPIIGTIAQLLGLVPQENQDAYTTGYNLIDNLKRGVEQKISEIPIIGDIARMLGLIPQQNDNAHSKGEGVGSNVDQGYRSGTSNLVSNGIQEFNDILAGIGDLFGDAYNTAKGFADQVWQGFNSVFQRASPGFFHDQAMLEFGTDIPNAIESSGDTAYSVAQKYGQQVRDGVASATQTNLGLDAMVGEYESDAQIIASSSQMMGTNTTTAFNNMQTSVNQSTNQMSTNVTSTYTSMQQKQASLLNNMKSHNTTAYNEMYLKSNQSLIQMRDSTSNVTDQMINAWSHMKNSIVATANKLKSDTTSHFNTLSDNIGSFYRKIQNPSNWGAGSGGSTGTISRGARSSKGRSFSKVMTRGASHHGAGSPTTYTGKDVMTIASLKKLMCPNGDCGNLFDGYNITDKVNVREFMASITGEHGFGSWSGWNNTHYNYIKNKSDQWSMKSPVINLAGGIDTNSSFKVGDFENGTPNISFSSFVSMAESIFSTIPYRYYYDSSWKGSWLGALQAGACNCSDGADALMAFAQTCNPNWSVSKVHGHWGKDGHFWAVINGKTMDTTAWQRGYGWTSPKVSGYGSPNVRRASPSSNSETESKTVHINVNMNNAVIYGVDDLDERITDGVKRGLREEFNDPYTVTI